MGQGNIGPAVERPPQVQEQPTQQQQALAAIGHSKAAQTQAAKAEPDAWKRLDAMVGMDPVKQQFQEILTMAQFRKARQTAGKPIEGTTMNMVFEGEPGTGKTVSARLLGEALFQAGVASGRNGQPVFVEVSPNSIKGQYVGWSTKNMEKAFKDAEGGMLFVDEANDWTSLNNEYGVEAMNTLMKLAEDNRDKVTVVLAGYPGLKEGLSAVNPGLPSRFPTNVEFPEYTAKDKGQIGLKMLGDNSFKVPPATRKQYMTVMEAMPGQARDVRNFNDLVMRSVAQRYGAKKKPTEHDLYKVTPADIKFAVQRYRDEEGDPLQLEV